MSWIKTVFESICPIALYCLPEGNSSNREMPGCDLSFLMLKAFLRQGQVFQCEERAANDPLGGVHDPLRGFPLSCCTAVPDAYAAC